MFIEPEIPPSQPVSAHVVDEDGLIDILDRFMNQGWEYINSVPWGSNNGNIPYFRCLRPPFVPLIESSRSPR